MAYTMLEEEQVNKPVTVFWIYVATKLVSGFIASSMFKLSAVLLWMRSCLKLGDCLWARKGFPIQYF